MHFQIRERFHAVRQVEEEAIRRRAGRVPRRGERAED
jgi:hypothetical protein